MRRSNIVHSCVIYINIHVLFWFVIFSHTDILSSWSTHQYHRTQKNSNFDFFKGKPACCCNCLKSHWLLFDKFKLSRRICKFTRYYCFFPSSQVLKKLVINTFCLTVTGLHGTIEGFVKDLDKQFHVFNSTNHLCSFDVPVSINPLVPDVH